MTKSLHSTTYRKLTELLVQARRKSGLTQQEVADALKTHQSYVAKVEGGERRIDIVEFMELAKALSVVPSSLLKKLEATQPAKEWIGKSELSNPSQATIELVSAYEPA